MRRLVPLATAGLLITATLASAGPTSAASDIASGASGNGPVTLSAATTRCTSGRAAFTRLAFPASAHSPSKFPGANDFAMFSATNKGTWAGVEYNSHTTDLYAITWRPGHAARVLHRYRYRNLTFHVPGSLDMVGVVPGGAAVASVQNPGRRVTGAYRTRMGVWWSARGRSHYLSHARSWLAWEPVGVSAAGKVVGWAAAGSSSLPRYYLVSWDRANKPYRTLARLGYDQPSIAIDGAGDVAWTQANGRPAVRMASGAVRQVRLPSGGRVTSMGASAHNVYAATANGVYGWPLGRTPATGTVARTLSPSASGRAAVDGVGPRGDLVMNSPGPAMMRRMNGARVAMPSMPVYSAHHAVAIDSRGVVAYTSSRDRRIHFMRCS